MVVWWGLMMSMRRMTIDRHVTVTIIFSGMLASAGFFMRTRFLVAQEGGNIAVVAGPAARTSTSTFTFRRTSLLRLTKGLSGVVDVMVRRCPIHFMMAVRGIANRK